METQLIGILILIADIYALYNIWTSNEDVIKKVIWSAVVIIFPLIGVIVWYFLGPKGG